MQNAVPSINADLLKIIPEYEGNPTGLPRLNETVSQITESYLDPPNQNCSQNILITNTIFSKLKCPGIEIMDIHNASNCAKIKSTLLQNFRDHRDQNTLIQKLIALRQESKTPQ
ncbi:hypothetical protein JTB14_000911 [Gonioctena quinquepunctata]|nr:hypothetical protein JTB14_000911 [Gonioctena quinquepunctata]